MSAHLPFASAGHSFKACWGLATLMCPGSTCTPTCSSRLHGNPSSSALSLAFQGCCRPDLSVPSLSLHSVGFGSVFFPWSHQVCEPLAGRDLAPCLATLDLCTVLAQGSSWPGKMSAWAFHCHRTGGATPPGRTHNSGTVAAAGVVNQADEQRILLPGYFTTPGLHPTHPLQASVAGPLELGDRVGWDN